MCVCVCVCVGVCIDVGVLCTCSCMCVCVYVLVYAFLNSVLSSLIRICVCQAERCTGLRRKAVSDGQGAIVRFYIVSVANAHQHCLCTVHAYAPESIL